MHIVVMQTKLFSSVWGHCHFTKWCRLEGVCSDSTALS